MTSPGPISGTIPAGQSLDQALRLFAGKPREEIPVVEDGRLVGTLRREHLLDAYNEELMKRDMVSELSSTLVGTATEEVHLGGGFQMAEIDAPGAFVDRSIRELDIRARYGAQVILIRRTVGGRRAPRARDRPRGPDTVVGPRRPSRARGPLAPH